MEILNIITEHKIIFSVLIGILVINFGCIFYLVFKERKDDKKEIDEILNEIEPKKEKNKIKQIEQQQDKKIEENKKEVEEMLLKMQKDMEAKPEDVVTNFEQEQEEKSIISYQELVSSVKEKNSTEVKVTPIKIEDETELKDKDEKIEVISNEKIDDLFDNDDTLKINPINDKDKKFKSTEFISPIFGKQDNKLKYPTVPKKESNILDKLDFGVKKEIDLINELNINDEDESIEKIIDTKKLDEEIKKNDDFLKSLKEFRKNLD